MTLGKAALIAGILALGATPALAWGDMYMGDGTSRAGQALVYPYPTKHNYCPEGVQPVLANGEVCCGVPNTHARYYNASGARKNGHRMHHRDYSTEGMKGLSHK